MKILKITLSTLILFTLSLNAQASEPISINTNPQSPITVSAEQPEFIIKLKSNPTTGYSWSLKEYDARYIKPLKHSFQAPSNPKLIGAPGYELWQLKAKPATFAAPSKTALHFSYQRPWEKNKPANEVTFWISTTN